jgi:sphinganine-1-phosphate aldolase
MARKAFPEQGRPAAELLAEIRALKTGDADWQGGRVPLFAFKGSEAASEIGREAFMELFTENALGAKRAFPSVAQMERDVVDMALSLFRAPEGAAGHMTTGGTESIILAVQACRDWDRARRGEPRHRGNIVACETAHPAFDKGARLMDIEVRRVPVGSDFRADPAAMAAAIDRDTFMLVGSAPCYSYGTIDPIDALGRLALERDLWLHVDACVGGYLAPFVRDLGRPIPAFDFAVPGVSSISADLHKYGFCPKPASTVLYAGAEKAARQGFDGDVWPSGRFTTATIVGTRPAGGIAAAWAVMQHLGGEGYRAIARDLMAFIDAYKAGVEAIDGLYVVGRPDLTLVAYGARDLDIFRVAEVMAAKGWVPGLVQRPKAIHRMMSMLHAPTLDDYLADLRAAVGVVRQDSGRAANIRATY